MFELMADQRSLHHHVSSVVVFGINKQSESEYQCFQLQYERYWGATNVMLERVKFNQIHFGDISSRWSSLCREVERDPSRMYADADDYRALQRLLLQYTPLAGFCRVVNIGSSSNRVYKITLPQWIENTKFVGVDLNTTHFVVKVVNRREEFYTEAWCLEKVSQYLKNNQTLGDAFFALGYCDCSTEAAPVYFTKNWRGYFEQIKSEMSALATKCRDKLAMDSSGWWHNRVEPAPGGVIIMRLGDFNPNGGIKAMMIANAKKLVNDTAENLLTWHRAGVIHRDVRRNNIMFFKKQEGVCFRHITGNQQPAQSRFDITTEGWQIIDASLSGINPLNEVDDEVEVTAKGMTSMSVTDPLDVNAATVPEVVAQRKSARLQAKNAGNNRYGGDSSCSGKPSKVGSSEVDWKSETISRLKEPRIINTTGGQYYDAGGAVKIAGRCCEKKFKFYWTPSDDFAMWEVFLRNLGIDYSKEMDW